MENLQPILKAKEMEVEGASVAVGGFLKELEVCISLDSRSLVDRKSVV